MIVDFEYTIPFHGNRAKAFSAALHILEPLGFEVFYRNDHTLNLEGRHPAHPRRSSLLNVSRLSIAQNALGLHLRAQYGALHQLRSRLFLLIVLFEFLSLLFVAALVPAWLFGLIAPISLAVTLLILSSVPIAARIQGRKTTRNLRVLLANIVRLSNIDRAAT